jgi:hypothetical protein
MNMFNRFKTKILIMLVAVCLVGFISPVAFAADTVVWYDGSISGTPVVPQMETTNNLMTIRRIIVDFSDRTLDAGDADVAQVIPVPAGTTVLSAWLRVITAETTNGTVDLGYGGSVNAWGNALAVDSTAGLILGATHDWVPIYFSSADTIDLVATTDTADVDIDGAKVEVIAVMLKTPDTEY